MKEKKQWAAIYVRVSKRDGRQDSGRDSQIRELRQYAKGHGLSPCRVYIDRASGACAHLPKLALLQRRISQGHVDTVLVSEISRFSRNGIKSGLDLICPWLKQGVRLISVAEGFDWSGDVGTLVASIFFWLAEQERRDIIRRTKRGLELAKARGIRLGPPVRLQSKTIVPLLESGLRPTEVARKLNCTSQGLYAALRREGVVISRIRGKR